MSSPTDDQPQRDHRFHTIRLAVLTSILSKFGTLILRLVSIPVAIRVLGMEEFGVYATITMIVGMIDTMHVGLGPALTQGISRAVAANDRDREKGIFATALLISTGLTLTIALVGALLLIFVPIVVLFGDSFAPFADSVYRACWIAIVLVSIELICLVIEKARDGYQETRYNNSWGAAGNFAGAAALLGGIKFFPTVEFLVLAINGSLALAKLCNSIHFIGFQRRYLFPRFSLFRKNLVKPLIRDGVLFSATGLSALVEYNAVGFLVGRIVGPAAAGVYAVMVTVHFSLTGLAQMVTIPTWPAVMDAHARGETEWIRRMANRLRLIGPSLAIAIGLGLVVFGAWALPMWAGEEFRIERLAIVTFSAYFVIHIWRHVNQMFVNGLGLVSMSAKVALVESLVVLGACLGVLWAGGDLATIYGAITLSLICLSGWMLPVIFQRKMKSLRLSASHSLPRSATGSALVGAAEPGDHATIR